MNYFKENSARLMTISDEFHQQNDYTYGELLKVIIGDFLDPFIRELPEPYSSCSEKIADAVEFIHENCFSSELSVGWIKEKCNITGDRFSAEFEIATGKSPRRYYTDLRIKAAKSILSKKQFEEVKIVSLAILLGFNTSEAFIQSFKNRCSVSPGAWRKSVLSN